MPSKTPPKEEGFGNFFTEFPTTKMNRLSGQELIDYIEDMKQDILQSGATFVKCLDTGNFLLCPPSFF
jgi:hypothetical protein